MFSELLMMCMHAGEWATSDDMKGVTDMFF